MFMFWQAKLKGVSQFAYLFWVFLFVCFVVFSIQFSISSFSTVYHTNATYSYGRVLKMKSGHYNIMSLLYSGF